MKTRSIITAIITVILLVFSSCREVTVTTRINRDGSFTRIITVTGDSTEVLTTDLPFPIDETWVRTSSKDSADSTKFIVKYSKSFRNSKQLNSEIQSDTSKYRHLQKEITITKKFRFFYSYLTFKEVYGCVNPFHNLDYRNYISEGDLRLSNGEEIPVTPADSAREKAAEDNIYIFLSESAAIELEAITRVGIKKLDDPLLNSIDISVYHDSVSWFISGPNFNKGEDILPMYDKWSGTGAFSLLKSLEPPVYEEFDGKLKKLNKIFELSGYTEEVEMPGLITATNSAMLQGNKVSWDFQSLPLTVTDLKYYAESRVINYWAFILSGIVLLALVVLLVVKAVR